MWNKLFFLQIWPVEYLGEGEWGSGASQCPSWRRSLQTNPCPPCNPQKKTLLSMICTNPPENSIFLLCLWNQCDVYRWTSASFQCTTHGQIYMYVETDTCTSTVLCYFFLLQTDLECLQEHLYIKCSWLNLHSPRFFWTYGRLFKDILH